jgi:phosphopantothenoylcysteine decarboxylase / phosphopantothenate---cysteine ligase
MHAATRKIKRDGSALNVELIPNPDIVAEVGEMPNDMRPFLIGFAAESDDLEANATGKLRDKGLDLIVGNVIGGPFDAIGSDENKVTVFGVEGPLTDWPMLPKRQVAERLWDLIADRYRKGRAETTNGRGGRRGRRGA